MAFKKASKGKSKTKKKSTKPVDREWTLEGGVVIDSARNDTEIEGKKRRQTQDKDDRIRRCQILSADRKRKQDFSRKMSTKISFNDVLNGGVDKEVINHENKSAKKAKISNLLEKSIIPLPVFDRLQILIKSTLNTSHSNNINKIRSVSESQKRITTASNTNNGMNNKHDITLGIESNNNHEIESALDIEQEPDENMSILNLDDNEDYNFDINNNNNSNHLWFFDSNTNKLEDNNKSFKKVKQFPDLNSTLYTTPLHPLLQLPTTPYTSMKHIPSLPKLWHSRSNQRFSPFQQQLFPYITSYADMLLEGRTYRNDNEWLHMILLHCMIHTVRSRIKVIKHDQKEKLKNVELKSQQQQQRPFKSKHKSNNKDYSQDTNHDDNIHSPILPASATSSSSATNNNNNNNNQHHPAEAATSGSILLEEKLDTSAQDQGYTRPRILLLLPFRSTALQSITTMINILGPNTTVINKDKLQDEFGYQDDGEDEDDLDNDTTTTNTSTKKRRDRPADWKYHFCHQNVDDDFKFGLQINPKQGIGKGADRGVQLKLFSDFYHSDIIIASPVGLKFAIENNKNNSDFLSSLEIIFCHQADILYQQNWDHVESVLDLTNKLPTANHDSNFNRIHSYFLNNESSLHRQLIMSTSFNDPILQSALRRHGHSLSGQMKLQPNYDQGVLADVVIKVRQIFQFVPFSDDVIQQETKRFEYFKEAVLEPLLRLEQKRTLIITPSYLNFVRVRNELIHQNANVAYISEYSRDSEVSRGRSRFFHGLKDILLYSGRAHFFRRYMIRGAKHIIFYSLPEYCHFYPELVNLLSDTVSNSNPTHTDGYEANSNNSSQIDIGSISCTVLYTLYERMALERIVGKARAQHMLSQKKTTFMFY